MKYNTIEELEKEWKMRFDKGGYWATNFQELTITDLQGEQE